MMRTEWSASPQRFLAALLLIVTPIVGACEEGAEDEAEPAVDPEAAVVTEEGVAGTTYFTDWDLDDDTYLTETEFATGWESLTLWEDWDRDADTYLDADEFGTAFGTYGWYDESLFGEWDLDDDDLLAEDELRTGIFETWDVEDDDRLAENEFDTEIF